MLNLRAKVTNHGFQPSEAAQELGLLLCRGVGMVCVATAAGDTTRNGKDTLGLVPGARNARMASIAAHFASAAIDATPHLQTFRPIGVMGTIRPWRLQRHHFGRRIGRGFSRVSFWSDLYIGRKWNDTCIGERQGRVSGRISVSDTGFGIGVGLVSFLFNGTSDWTVGRALPSAKLDGVKGTQKSEAKRSPAWSFL